MTEHVHDFVALAASTEQKATTQARDDAKKISSAAVRATLATQKWVTAALTPSVTASLRVGGKDADPADVVKRSDIQKLYKGSASAVGSRVHPLIDKSWNAGKSLGDAAARRQAKIHGLEKPKPSKLDRKLLQRFHDDLDNIQRQTPKILSEAYVNGGEVGLQNARKKLAYRTGLVLDAVVKHAAETALEQGLRSETTQKMWITQSSNPCEHCKRLNGMVRDWGQAFPKKFLGLRPLPTYTPRLEAPPRHPHCSCIVVSVPKKGDTKDNQAA